MRAVQICIVLLLAPIAPAAASGATYGDVAGVRLVDCHDGDTCRFDIPGWPAIAGAAIRVRLAGVQAPELPGHCEAETRRGEAARDRLAGLLEQARSIDLRRLRRGKYFRIVAEIWADGAPVADRLLEEGLARPSEDGAPLDWCH